MKKSIVIARCLVNSKIVSRLEDAELSVRQVFSSEFPDEDYNEWNQNINEATAKEIIRNVGRASRINIKLFIEDLR